MPLENIRTLVAYLSDFFLVHSPPPADIYTLSLHDALPISLRARQTESASRDGTSTTLGGVERIDTKESVGSSGARSEEHTSELQSRFDLVCRLLLEKKKKQGRATRNSPNTRRISNCPERRT